MKPCPLCGQQIQDNAIKCKHCKQWIKTPYENIQKKNNAIQHKKAEFENVNVASDKISNTASLKVKTGYFSLLWSPIYDSETASSAAKRGFYAAIYSALFTTIVAVWKENILVLVDAGIFAIIGFAIFRMSRVASILGLCFYLFTSFGRWYGAPKGARFPWFILIVMMYINSIRGTFAYHQYLEKK